MSIKSKVKKLTSECWNIGFIENNLDSVMAGDPIKVRWLCHDYKDRWFADPFILDVNEREIVVLAEEYYKPISRGRISRLSIDKSTMKLNSLDVILELDTHLSFPIIERTRSGVYIYPESGESNQLAIFKYDDNQRKCEKAGVLIHEALADSVMLKLDSGTYLFTTPISNPNGNRLRIFSKDKNTNQFNNFEEVEFKENIARMAGDFFFYNDKLYRPAQECNYQYGHAISIQNVRKEDGLWHFEEVRRIYSEHPFLNIGSHTFNIYKGVIVTDALGFDRMWIRKILKILGIIH